MEIVMIRHAKVDMMWQKKYNSINYDLDCEKYNLSSIVPVTEKFADEDERNIIYISDLSRTYDTAYQLFGQTNFYKTELFDEVPLKSYKDTTKAYPLFVWHLMGRLQWALNSKRQIETRKQTVLRAKEAVRLLEENKENCFVVTHGFFMRTLLKELKSKGYKIKKTNRFGISNLERITACN
jgi:broad specificity phosphatase PhoE